MPFCINEKIFVYGMRMWHICMATWLWCDAQICGCKLLCTSHILPFCIIFEALRAGAGQIYHFCIIKINALRDGIATTLRLGHFCILRVALLLGSSKFQFCCKINIVMGGHGLTLILATFAHFVRLFVKWQAYFCFLLTAGIMPPRCKKICDG